MCTWHSGRCAGGGGERYFYTSKTETTVSFLWSSLVMVSTTAMYCIHVYGGHNSTKINQTPGPSYIYLTQPPPTTAHNDTTHMEMVNSVGGSGEYCGTLTFLARLRRTFFPTRRCVHVVTLGSRLDTTLPPWASSCFWRIRARPFPIPFSNMSARTPPR